MFMKIEIGTKVIILGTREKGIVKDIKDNLYLIETENGNKYYKRSDFITEQQQEDEDLTVIMDLFM